MRLTAVKSGSYVVLINGVVSTSHTSEREAIEAAVNHEEANPSDVVTYRHDYEVRVEATVRTRKLSGIAVKSNTSPPRQVRAFLLGGVPLRLSTGQVRKEEVKSASLSGLDVVSNSEDL